MRFGEYRRQMSTEAIAGDGEIPHRAGVRIGDDGFDDLLVIRLHVGNLGIGKPIGADFSIRAVQTITLPSTPLSSLAYSVLRNDST